MQGVTYTLENQPIAVAPKLDNPNLEKRADRIVELAVLALAAKPQNAVAILHELYAQAITDFEVFKVDERPNERGEIVRTYKRAIPGWNPSMR